MLLQKSRKYRLWWLQESIS